MPRTLEVITPEGRAGALVRESQHVFNYAAVSPDVQVAMSMPIRAASYVSHPLHPPFAMNLPEGYVLERLRLRLAKFGRVDDLLLLERTGRQQIGRLQFLKEPRDWAPPQAVIGLARLLQEGASKGAFEELLELYLESGISGVQPKALIPDADRPPGAADRSTIAAPELIVKSTGNDWPGVAANEFACMSAARRAGLDVPPFWLSDDERLFVMRRFDLDPARRGFEDIATLSNIDREPTGHYKFRGSYEAVATVIGECAGSNRSSTLTRFFEALTLSVCVRNGDAHLKNFGVTYSTPNANDVQLAPLFDVVTTSVYGHTDPATGDVLTDRTMALKLFRKDRQKRYPDRAELVAFGRTACAIDRPEAIIDRIAESVIETRDAELERVPATIHEAMRAAWEEGVDSLAPGTLWSLAPAGP
jgi:serine/threonine-protein kinase HipA